MLANWTTSGLYVLVVAVIQKAVIKSTTLTETPESTFALKLCYNPTFGYAIPLFHIKNINQT
jgi:hypothetical protein